MYIASYRKNKIRYSSRACDTREQAAAAFFAEHPKLKSCSSSEAFERDGLWIDRNSNIQFHDRPWGKS
jgi:hypothetical protein